MAALEELLARLVLMVVREVALLLELQLELRQAEVGVGVVGLYPLLLLVAVVVEELVALVALEPLLLALLDFLIIAQPRQALGLLVVLEL